MPESKGWSGSCLAYTLICFGPIVVGALLYPFVGEMPLVFIAVCYALVSAGLFVAWFVFVGFQVVMVLFRDARAIEREFEIYASRPALDGDESAPPPSQRS